MKIPSTQPLASRRIVLGSSIGVFAATVAVSLNSRFWLSWSESVFCASGCTYTFPANTVLLSPASTPL